MKTLHVAEGLTFPLELVTETFAVLAKRRMGKSFLLRRIIEQLAKASVQIVDVDPKGDHWGLRSAADGKAAGLSILILGGEHGDLPLEVGSGELVAKLVVEERVSVLLDLSHFRKHEIATFMAIFLEALYRLKAQERYRTPLMLLVDEADAIAPQKPQPNEARMLGAIEDIVRRGGQRGIGCGMVSQRAAVLNKNVLTQVQLMIALRTVSPQDRKAMEAWIEVHGEPEQQATMMASLADLPVGDAWFWSPGWPTTEGIFQRAHVLPIETFDSGATPKAGEKRIEPKRRADVDLDALKVAMAETIERAKATDPKALQAKVKDLEAQVKKLQATKVPATKEVPKEVYVLKEGQLRRMEKLASNALAAGEAFRAGAVELARVVAPAMVPSPSRFSPPLAPVVRQPAAPPPPINRPVVAARVQPGLPAGDQEPLGKGERIILTAIAQHGAEGVTREQLTVLTGYKRSTRDAYLQRLDKRGILGIDGDRIAAMETRLLGDNFQPLPTGAALLDHWRRELPEGERAVLDVAVQHHPEPVDREAISIATGYKRSTRDAYIQRSIARRLLVDMGRGTVRASDMLFGA